MVTSSGTEKKHSEHKVMDKYVEAGDLDLPERFPAPSQITPLTVGVEEEHENKDTRARIMQRK